ncbi:MAG: PA14 domain-containing protein, partial [Myxococcota bacterium]
DDEVSAADARLHQQISESTSSIVRAVVNGTRSPRELRAVRRRRWFYLVSAVSIVLVLIGLRIVRSIEEANAPWIGRYYPALNFQGEPEERGDLRISFDWGSSAPMGGLPADRFTARWDTCLRLDGDEEITVSVRSDDGHRVFINEENVLNNWSPQSAQWATGRKELGAGLHHIRIEYFEQGGNARVGVRLASEGSGDLQDRLSRPRDPDSACE